MSQKNYKDLEAEMQLERKENKPKEKEIVKATILVKNNRGIYVDIARTYEGFVSTQELGSKSVNSLVVGEQIELLVQGEEKNQEGVYRLSFREVEQKQKWSELEKLEKQNLDLTISKVGKSGVEVKINLINVIGFIPFLYLDSRQEVLKNTNRDNWVGLHILGRIHELDAEKNKIIINHKVICDEIKETKAEEIMNSIAVGTEIDCEVIRLADFGVFVDIGGFDALIPLSELSWRRFKKPADVVKIGEKLKAKVFKIEKENKRIALSIKQAQPDPWTVLAEEIKVGYKTKAKVVSHAEFGVFVEVIPGVEALLHKSNFSDEQKPELNTEVNVEIINIDANKKRMGVKFQEESNVSIEGLEELINETKELEHV